MKQILLILAFLMCVFGNAQTTISPTLGFKYSGGLQYGAIEEFFNMELGVLLENKNKKFLPDGYSLNYQMIYDSNKGFTGTNENLYAIRFQTYKMTLEPFAIAAGASYMGSYNNTFKKPHFGFSTGILLIDDRITGGMLYERYADYPYFSIVVTARLFNKKLR